MVRADLKRELLSLIRNQADLPEDKSFESLCDEVEALFTNGSSISKHLERGEGPELIDYLASMVYDETRKPGQVFFDQVGKAVSGDPLGLTRVIELIADLKKPIITHNGIMDLMFLYQAFFGTLPTEVNEFKREIHRLFPSIHDTRHLINARLAIQKELPQVLQLSDIFKHLMSPTYQFN